MHLLLVVTRLLALCWTVKSLGSDHNFLPSTPAGPLRRADSDIRTSTQQNAMTSPDNTERDVQSALGSAGKDEPGETAGRDSHVEVGEQANPNGFEVEYVHGVYDVIADHFSHTRYKAWPKVAEFLNSIPDGSLVADIGCGNGKYLSTNPRVWMHGSDRSANLLQHCTANKQDVLVADALCLPYKSSSFDAAISIAVIHHLSTEERRIAALKEALRVLRPGGRLLVYNWAIEQEGRFGGFKDQDQLIPWHLNKKFGTDVVGHGEKAEAKHCVVYKRFYHLFRQGETERLFAEAGGCVVRDAYYDHANWCAIVAKSAPGSPP